MTKKIIKGGLWIHNEHHIDIDIPLNSMPFDIKLGEELYCAVKGVQNRGIQTDFKAHLFVVKKDNNSINEAITGVNSNFKNEEMIEKYKELLTNYKKKIKNQKQSIKDLVTITEKQKEKIEKLRGGKND